MMNTSPATVAAYLRRIASAALFAVAVAFGSNALGYPAIANAVWDVEIYDRCVAMNINPGDDLATQLEYEESCCKDSGGVWNDNVHSCQAPAAQGPGADPSTPPTPKAGIPTAPVQPPTVGSPTTSVIVPTVPVQPPTVGSR